jgi:hypothetical protein
MTKQNKLDLSPGCGTVIKKNVGPHKVTITFSSNAEESRKARERLVAILMNNATAKAV